MDSRNFWCKHKMIADSVAESIGVDSNVKLCNLSCKFDLLHEIKKIVLIGDTTYRIKTFLPCFMHFNKKCEAFQAFHFSTSTQNMSQRDILKFKTH